MKEQPRCRLESVPPGMSEIQWCSALVSHIIADKAGRASWRYAKAGRSRGACREHVGAL